MADAYRLDTDCFSESVGGRPIRITSSTSTAADPVHIMAASDVLDCAWMTISNRGTGIVECCVVINPADDTVLADVQDASFFVSIPNRSSILVLEGLRLRVGTGAYTIGVYLVNAGDSGKLQVTGWVNRSYRAQMTY